MSDLRTADSTGGGSSPSAGCVGAGALLAACTSNDPDTATNNDGQAAVGNNDNAAAGTEVTIGFSAPAGRPRLDRRDHATTPRRRPKKYSDVDVRAGRGRRNDGDPADRRGGDPDREEAQTRIVMLPYDGKAAQRGRRRRRWRPASRWSTWTGSFDTPQAYRTLIKGDNYGMGVSAGHVHRRPAQGQGRQQPGHRRDRRHRQPAADPGPQPRASRTRWPSTALKVANRRPAEFTVESGQRSRPTCSRPAEDRRDVEPRRRPGRRRAGRDQAGRPQRVLHGRRRRLGATRCEDIQADNTRAQGDRHLQPDRWRPRRSRWPG